MDATTYFCNMTELRLFIGGLNHPHIYVIITPIISYVDELTCSVEYQSVEVDLYKCYCIMHNESIVLCHNGEVCVNMLFVIAYVLI